MNLIANSVDVRLGGALILKDISFSLGAGETVALLGPNGAGKSTLVKAIAGIVHVSGGDLRRDEESAGGSFFNPLHQTAYIPQEGIGKTGLSVIESVLLGRYDRLGLHISDADLRAAHAALERFGITDFAERRLDTLSGGQRQLAGLAQALFRTPNIMLLDEPTSALDLYRQMLVLDNLKCLAKERGIAIVCVLHDLSLAARFAERIMFLKGGRLVADDRSDVVLTGEMIGRVYNIDAEILRGSDGHIHVAPIRPIEAGVRWEGAA